MLHAVCFVGGLDVHKGHGGGLSILRVFFVTEDFHTLDPSKSFEILFDAVFSDVFREVAHPKVPSLSDHGVFDGRSGEELAEVRAKCGP